MRVMKKVHLPFRYITCPITAFGYVIECLAEFTSIAPWLFAIDAYVEKLAIVWIGITWVRGTNTLVYFRACELEQFCK